MIRAILAAAILFAAVPASAETPTTLDWDDLIPEAPQMADPLIGVDMIVRYDLGFIAQVMRDERDGKIAVGGPEYQNAMSMLDALKAERPDAERLIDQLLQQDAEIAKRMEAVRPDLDGRTVRMPGYALPLESTDEGVTEFLLVPYVGACIHVPPPPPNQIVYVSLDRPHRIEGLYEPVWITGRMRAQSASRALSFVDGQSNVATGYTVQASLVEAYE